MSRCPPRLANFLGRQACLVWVQHKCKAMLLTHCVVLLQTRARLLNKFADLLDEHAVELATLECLVSLLFDCAACSAPFGPDQGAVSMTDAFLTWQLDPKAVDSMFKQLMLRDVALA